MPDTEQKAGTKDSPAVDTLEYCRKRVLAPRSRLSMTLGFVPESHRTSRVAFYTLLADLADIAEQITEPTVAVAKLGWWQEELQRARLGQPRHPVTRLLVAEGVFGNLDPARLNQLLAGIEASQDLPTFKDIAALRAHCQRLGGTAALLELQLAGVDDPEQQAAALSFGSGQYLTRLLVDISQDAAAGRWWVPRGLQAQFDVDQAAVLDRSERAQAMINSLAQTALDWLQAKMPVADSHVRIQQALDQRLARRCYQKPGHCLAGGLGRQPIRETFTAWRVARATSLS